MPQLCTQADVVFVETCFDTIYQSYALHPEALKQEAKHSPYDPEDDGVPPEMFDGKPGKDGYVRWKMVEGGLTEDAVVGLEQEYSIMFPPLFRACLLARRQLFEHVGPRVEGIEWVASPSDNPLGPLRELLNAWRPLAAVGFVAFAMLPDDVGPVCFDTRQGLESDDCPIVTFDHEVLFELEQNGKLPIEATAAVAAPLFRSFRQLMFALFLQRSVA